MPGLRLADAHAVSGRRKRKVWWSWTLSKRRVLRENPVRGTVPVACVLTGDGRVGESCGSHRVASASVKPYWALRLGVYEKLDMKRVWRAAWVLCGVSVGKGVRGV